MCRTRSDRKMNAPLSTATRCRLSGKSHRMSRASSATRFWICSSDSRISTGRRSDMRRHHTAMKRFEIITESDARLLGRGETVMLARGGHVTPLARDTLKDLRVVVLEDAPSDDERMLAPVEEILRIAIACNHNDNTLCQNLLSFLRRRGLAESV